jgi:uncharacterized protein (DUF1778 family)
VWVPSFLPRGIWLTIALKAEEVLAERSSIRLSEEAAAAFSEALEHPEEVNERLAAALRHERKFSWLD